MYRTPKKQMKHWILLLLLFLISSSGWSQKWSWSIKASGNNQASEDTDIAVDNRGNIVVAGYYRLKLQLDTFTIYQGDKENNAIFMCRLDSARKVKWLKHIEMANGYEPGIGVTTDNARNIYLTGAKAGKIFVAKYDSMGQKLWLCDFDKMYPGSGHDVAIDQLKNVYVTGKSGLNHFVGKVDYSGNLVWTKQFIGCGHGGYGNEIVTDKFGAIYISGWWNCEYLMMDDIKITKRYSTQSQVYIAKISADGEVKWAKSPDGISLRKPQLAMVNDGVLISEMVSSTEMDFGNGVVIRKTAGGNYGSPFIAKYHFDGTIQWAKTIYNPLRGEGMPNDMVTDLEGNVYFIGTAFSSSAGNDFYVEKLDKGGSLQWSKLVKTPESEFGKGIGVDNDGNAYIVGYSALKNFIGSEVLDFPFTMGIARLQAYSPATYSDNMKLDLMDDTYQLFPNPTTNGLVTLQIRSDLDDSLAIKVFNHMGRMIITKEIQGQKGLTMASIDLCNFAKGAYFVCIKGNKINKTIKIIRN